MNHATRYVFDTMMMFIVLSSEQNDCKSYISQ